jgi:polysaccharide biosynthesis transport protein
MNGLYDEIRVALHKIWRRRWLALLVAWGICLLGWLVISLIPNKYQSDATIFVQTQSMLPDKVGVSREDRAREVERVKNLLTSTVNLEKVVKNTSLGKNLTTPQEVTAMAMSLKSLVKVEELRENMFKISAESNLGGRTDRENATLARDLVQSMIDVFVEENIAGNKGETAQTLEFLDKQIDMNATRMHDSENALIAFQQKNVGMLPGIGSSSMRRESLRMELNQVESQLIQAQSSLSATNAQLGSTPPMLTGASSYVGGGGPASARLAGLEAQIESAQARGWTDSHPDMQALQKEVARARVAAANESTGRMVGGSSTPNPAYGPLRSMQAQYGASVAALSQRRAQLGAELASQNAHQIDEPGLAAEQDRLTREYDGVKAQYQKLLADRESIRLRGDMDVSTGSVKFSITDPPAVAKKPSAPDRPVLLTGVLLFGLLAGAGVSFVVSQLQTGFSTAKQLATSSGMSVIGAISEVLTPKQRSAISRRNRYFRSGAAALAGAYALLIVVDIFQRSGLA